MCGRYVQATPIEEVLEFLQASPRPGVVQAHRPSWNIPPTVPVLGIARSAEGERVAEHYRWGLVPSWAKDLSLGNHAFNARAESVAEKPMFRSAYLSKHLVVPADAYYEWQLIGARRKQPRVFRRRDGAPLVFAGLWEVWRGPGAEDWLLSCSVITTEASKDIVVHDRMPVILSPEDIDAWLDTSVGPRAATSLLCPAPVGTLLRQAVSSRVSSSANDGPELLDPLVSQDGEILDVGQLSWDSLS